jgi:NitT/TauT family transport system substrate-binding protein
MDMFGLRKKRLRARLLTAVAILSIAAPQARAQQLKKIVIGIPSPLNTVLALWMADQAGFYKQQGLDAEFKATESGSHGAAMIQSGEIQVMQVGMSSVIDINRGGGDIRTIGSLSNVNRFTLFGAPGVKTSADLKGGAVAISGAGSETDTTTSIILDKLGLKRADVQIKEVGGGPARLASLKSGAVRASPLNEPSSTLARQQGLPVLVDLAAENFPWLLSSIVVKASYLQADRPTLLRFMKATVEGNYLAVHDKARAKEVLARELKIKDPATLNIIYEDFAAGTPVTTEPSAQAIADILQYVRPNTGKASDYIDDSLLRELRDEGFFDAMTRKYGG